MQNPATPVADGDGGYTQAWSTLVDAWASIQTATQRTLERLVASTVTAQASHVVRMRHHPSVTQTSRIVWVDRAGTSHTANVTDVQDPDGSGTELILLCAEVLP